MIAKNSPLRAVILASGEGSNAEAIIRWAIDHPGRLKVCGILTDNPQAGVIARAKKYAIPAGSIPFPAKSDASRSFASRKQQHEQAMLDQINEWRAEWILLAGYMRILSSDFLVRHGCSERGNYRVINIHPSLLPDFPGRDALKRAFSAGVAESGVTVHLVDEGIDTGPVLAQERFPRLPDDDFESFAARGREVEHRLYTMALDRLTRPELHESALLGSKSKGAMCKTDPNP